MCVRRAALALASVVVLSTAGCITFYSKTEVVGGSDARVPVSFENVEAAQQFQDAVKRMDSHAGGTYVGLPLITVYQQEQRLSETALWNDAVRRCDTNQDGVITCDEVAAFAKSLNR
jgi:hypothetical protein